MKLQYVSRTGAARLILIYAGWAMDAAPFEGLRRPGYDIAVVWDYREFQLDWSFATPYSEVCVVAWSLGVYAAAVTAPALARRITCRIAVNGTLWPVDPLLGIPPKVFAGTAAGLNERQLGKFYRRVCGGREIFSAFSERIPARSVPELLEELGVFLSDNLFAPQIEKRWDMALISSDDAIFPPVNQWRAWRGTPVRFMDGPHLPDMQKIIDRYIIDKDQTRSRFARGMETYDSQASVQSDVVRIMDEVICGGAILQRISRRGARTLEIGSGTGTLTACLDRVCGTQAYLEMWDLAGQAPVAGPMRCFRNTDAEMSIMRVPSSSFDLIASASTVQWFNSPSRFLCECLRVLAPGGFLVFSTFAKGNLWQITETTGVGLPLLTAVQWAMLVPQGLSVIDMNTYRYELEFDSAVEAFRHLRLTGVDSLGRGEQSVNPVAAVRKFLPDLDGKYRLTYRPLIVIMRKEQ